MDGKIPPIHEFSHLQISPVFQAQTHFIMKFLIEKGITIEKFMEVGEDIVKLMDEKKYHPLLAYVIMRQLITVMTVEFEHDYREKVGGLDLNKIDIQKTVAEILSKKMP